MTGPEPLDGPGSRIAPWVASYASAVMLYLAAGWRSVLPLPAGFKGPPPRGFTGRTSAVPSDADYEHWVTSQPDGNVALRLPDGVIGIDVDQYRYKRGGDNLLHEQQQRDLPGLPPTWYSSARGEPQDRFVHPSGIHFYRTPERLHWFDNVSHVETIWWGHRYAVVWPSTNPHAGGAPYRWRGPDGALLPDGQVPAVAELLELPEAWIGVFSDGPLDAGGGHVGARVTDAELDAWLIENDRATHPAMVEQVVERMRDRAVHEPRREAMRAATHSMVHEIAAERYGSDGLYELHDEFLFMYEPAGTPGGKWPHHRRSDAARSRDFWACVSGAIWRAERSEEVANERGAIAWLTGLADGGGS